MITHDALLGMCLSFPGAFEDHPFGADSTVVKVRAAPGRPAKMFALLMPGEQATRINLKCDPELAEYLRRQYQWVLPGYHMNKRHWNTVVVPHRAGATKTAHDASRGESAHPTSAVVGGVTEKLIHDFIEDSYDLVVASMPRRDRLLLDWPPTKSG